MRFRGPAGGLFAAFCVMLAALQPAWAQRKVDLELVLAADVSGSMDLEEAALQRQGFVSALRHPDVVATIQRGRLGRIAVSYVEWADDHFQTTLADWAEISDAASAAAFAAKVEDQPVRTAYWTSISTVISYAGRQFQNNGFSARRRIVDISGDGPNNTGEFVIHARDRALAAGITIDGLPIINGRPGPYGFMPLPNLDHYYEDCVIGGFGAFVVVAYGFRDFTRAIRRKMILEIAGVRPSRPLLHRAVAEDRPPCNAGEVQLRYYRSLRDFNP